MDYTSQEGKLYKREKVDVWMTLTRSFTPSPESVPGVTTDLVTTQKTNENYRVTLYS